MIKKQTLYAWLLLLPALVLLLGFTHIPALKTFWHSFIIDAPGVAPKHSLDNYRFLLEDDILWQVLRNNFIYLVITVPLSIAIALLMALWVNARLAGQSLLRLSYFTPTILPMIAVANIWLFFYSPEIGLLNRLLGYVGHDGYNWLGDSNLALYSLMAMTIWKEAGFFMIFYLAALQNISPDLYHAAHIDNASRWYQFKRITFPLLMPTTLFVAVNAVLNAFKLVDHLFILTKGGPNNASNLLLYYIYETAFSFLDSAYAATLSVIMLVILITLAVIQFTLVEKRVHYQ